MCSLYYHTLQHPVCAPRVQPCILCDTLFLIILFRNSCAAAAAASYLAGATLQPMPLLSSKTEEVVHTKCLQQQKFVVSSIAGTVYSIGVCAWHIMLLRARTTDNNYTALQVVHTVVARGLQCASVSCTIVAAACIAVSCKSHRSCCACGNEHYKLFVLHSAIRCK
jgi:hypothetical protein